MRTFLILGAAALLLIAFINFRPGVEPPTPTPTTNDNVSTATLEKWTGDAAKLQGMIAEGKPMVIDFYADW